MERRIFLAIVVSLALLWIWAAAVPRLFPELVKKQQQSAATTSTAAESTTPSSTTTTATPAATTSAPTSALTPAAPIAPISADHEQQTTIETSTYIARFSNRGAQLVSFQLKDYREDDGQPVELVKARPPGRTDYPFSIQARDFTTTRALNNSLYRLTDRRSETGERILEYEWAGGGISSKKEFRLNDDYAYRFAATVTPAMPYRIVVGPGIRTLPPEAVDTSVIITGNGVVHQDGDFEVIPREKGDALQSFASVGYIGIEDNYFLTVVRPRHSGEGVLRRVKLTDERKDLYAGINAAPDGSVSGEAYFGPKEAEVLDRHGLSDALQLGWFDVIARFFLKALVWINTFTHNYGFAIVVLTFLIKIVLFPLQYKSIVSMRKMQKLQPKMEAIKAKYKKAKTDADQRQKMNVDMMQLYQKEGINPMAGCFPILLQLPILWAFYGLLSRAIELRNAPFIGWIQDLSEKDPYYITPALMTLTWWYQTYITPAAGDPMQRRILLFMPFIFGFMFKDFPSGLVVYWLVQNILTIFQQLIMNKWWQGHPADDPKV